MVILIKNEKYSSGCSKHKYSNILENFGNSDITYNISFNLINQIIKKFGHLFNITTKKNF